jgi:hypothetical protein
MIRGARKYWYHTNSLGSVSEITDSSGAAKRVPVWSRGYWVRFLNRNTDITAAVAYVNRQAIAPHKCGG